MSEQERTETALRRAVLAGDRRAWEALYESAFDGLFAYVQWRCGGVRAWTDDLVQETWLVAVRRIKDFRPEQARFLSWLRGIASHLLHKHFRDLRRYPVSFEGIQDLPSTATRPDAAAERIAQALAELPAHYEAVLRAKYVDRRNMTEMATEGRTTVKAVESLLSRAREALRDAYQSLEAQEERAQP
jgi:RNA polymerase sigma-70 factor (ECF subfamily)